jgi:predicted MFS family arabinose efflux permease
MITSETTAQPAARHGAAHVRYWKVWCATLLFFAGFYALLIPLPRYLAALGLAEWQIGLVLGAFGVASLVGRPLAGLAADRWGSRWMLLLGAAALSLGSLGVGFTQRLPVLFGLRLLQALGYVAFTTAATTLVIALVPEDERGRRLAVFGAAVNVAITAAPAAVGALLAVAPLASGFWLAGGLALAAGVLALWVEAPRLATDTPRRQVATWGGARRLWLPMLATALLGASFAAFFQFAPVLAERRGVAPGILYTVYGSGIIVARLAGGRWLDRVDVGRVLALAVPLIACGLAIDAVAWSVAWLGLAALLVAIGSGLFHPALLAHHARLLPGRPGRASAAFYVGFDLGIGVGSWLLGAALQLGGVAGLYAAGALAALGALLLAPALARQHGATRSICFRFSARSAEKRKQKK